MTWVLASPSDKMRLVTFARYWKNRVAELMKTASTAEEKRSLLKEGKATWHGLEVLIGLSSELGLDTL